MASRRQSNDFFPYYKKEMGIVCRRPSQVSELEEKTHLEGSTFSLYMLNAVTTGIKAALTDKIETVQIPSKIDNAQVFPSGNQSVVPIDCKSYPLLNEVNAMQVTIYLENLSDMFFVPVTLIAKSIDLKGWICTKRSLKNLFFSQNCLKNVYEHISLVTRHVIGRQTTGDTAF